MKRAGCLGLLIGFESVQKGTQDEVNKIRNPMVDFYEAMNRFHDEGFGILGCFVGRSNGKSLIIAAPRLHTKVVPWPGLTLDEKVWRETVFYPFAGLPFTGTRSKKLSANTEQLRIHS